MARPRSDNRELEGVHSRGPLGLGERRRRGARASTRYSVFVPAPRGHSPEAKTRSGDVLAEREGFEPSVELLTPHTISSRAPSTTRSSLQRGPRRRPATSPDEIRYLRPESKVPGSSGGEGGIRTPGTVPRTLDFESSALNQLGHLSITKRARSTRSDRNPQERSRSASKKSPRSATARAVKSCRRSTRVCDPSKSL